MNQKQNTDVVLYIIIAHTMPLSQKLRLNETEVFTMVKVYNIVFWVMTLYSLECNIHLLWNLMFIIVFTMPVTGTYPKLDESSPYIPTFLI